MEVTSNSNLELPKFVLCFCQKLSGLMIRATWMQQGKDSCRIFSSGLMESHLDPRMSTITVKPRLHTSSLGRRKHTFEPCDSCHFFCSASRWVVLTLLPPEVCGARDCQGPPGTVRWEMEGKGASLHPPPGCRSAPVGRKLRDAEIMTERTRVSPCHRKTDS